MYEAALAEQLPPNRPLPDRPHLYAVPDIADEPQAQAHVAHDAETEPIASRRYEDWLGGLTLAAAGARELDGQPANVNILERIEAARAGSQEARDSLSVNVATATFEGLLRVDDYVGETFMDRTEQGELVQHGQTNADIYHNAIAFRPNRHPVLQEITEAESKNRHRIEAALEADKLKDHYYVVFSFVPDGVPEKELGPDGDGYFLDNLALNIQATTELPDGRVKTEVAFMAGVEEDGNDTFDERLARRHDLRAGAVVYGRLGLEPPDTAGGFIDAGVYIPKDMMPNGIVDPMYWLDVAKAEVLGGEVEREPEDYLELRPASKRREASLKNVHERVLEDLIVADDLKTPPEAIQRVWDLVKAYATEDALTNLDIDPRAFGRDAAPDIIRARYHLQKGNYRDARHYMQRAHEGATLAGCGGGSSARKQGEGEPFENFLEKIAGSDEKGSLAFLCPNGHLNVRPYNGTVPSCQHDSCKAKVAC